MEIGNISALPFIMRIQKTQQMNYVILTIGIKFVAPATSCVRKFKSDSNTGTGMDFAPSLTGSSCPVSILTGPPSNQIGIEGTFFAHSTDCCPSVRLLPFAETFLKNAFLVASPQRLAFRFEIFRFSSSCLSFQALVGVLANTQHRAGVLQRSTELSGKSGVSAAAKRILSASFTG